MSNKVDDFLNKIQTEKVNLTQIAKDAKISYGKMSKWKQRNVQSSQINQEDYEKLSNYLDKKKDSDENLDTKKDTPKDAFLILAESNLNLAIANRELAEGCKVLAEQFTAGAALEIRKEMSARFADLIDIIQKLSDGQSVDEDVSKFWHDQKSKSVSSNNNQIA